MMDNQLTDQERRDGWRLLFDGKSLEGWAATGRLEGWTVDEGCLVCTVQGGGYLYSLDQFEDFVLALEFKIAPNTNSGIFVRWSDLHDPVNTGLEIQVLDSYESKSLGTHTCGAIYDLVPPSRHVFRPAGEWNQIRITCRGPQVSVFMNGEDLATIDLDRYTQAGKNPDGSANKFTHAWADLPRKGHIGLQDHGGRIWFRNLKLLA